MDTSKSDHAKAVDEMINPNQAKPALFDEPMLQFFEWEHLPEKLQEASKPFGDLAAKIARDWPRNPERTVALRKLLEAKDAAVRAMLYTQGK